MKAFLNFGNQFKVKGLLFNIILMRLSGLLIALANVVIQ